MFRNCTGTGTGLPGFPCSKISLVLVRLTVHAVERFSHHVELRLGVALEDKRLVLAKQLTHKVVGRSARALGI